MNPFVKVFLTKAAEKGSAMVARKLFATVEASEVLRHAPYPPPLLKSVENGDAAALTASADVTRSERPYILIAV